jgi:CHASE2 domain-containing sensor protein
VTDEPAPHPERKRRWFTFAALAAERRRAVISFGVGLIVLLLIQIPAIEQSFLGAPDREMIQTAFRLRADLTGGTAEPVLFIDMDDRTMSKLAPVSTGFAPPLATTPRAALADLLEFMRSAPPATAPRVVIMDVDIAEPSSDGPEGVQKLQKVLADWAATKTAPPLIISRETFPATALGIDRPQQVLPDSPYDSIVGPAANIFWSEPSVQGDLNGFIREFLPYQCVISSHDPNSAVPLYSAALLAYQFAERDQAVLDHAPAKHWMTEAATHCQTQSAVQLSHGERIDFHISLEHGFLGRVWPDLSPAWPGFRQCGHDDPAVFRRLSGIDILDAIHSGGDVSRALLCQHVVIIGGTNAVGADFVMTPLNEMNGSVVLANAIRGLQLTHGGLKAIPLIFQVLLLLVITVAMSATNLATARARRHYRHLRRNVHTAKFHHRLVIIPLNPIVLNGLIALAAQGLGIALLTISLNFGYWGFLSAPVYAAALTETLQEFGGG